ncbi:Hypothetical protein LUCI_2419 [Lucifera butyrica]|uniref:Type II toxin-antitoxin system RelE/ParE family toxin n=1 Tax=Lucifera butyrica TaxID=1351585 RepID=A0A498R870_9FIRM|nr:type II toxin-antitoxin system RelE/ParE family toxin [Lucifera butyrica]VBB07175.1 Hypothetical protein LUCI_2419 [Lucifera butyrica]
MPSIRQRKKYTVNITPRAEADLERLTDWWLFEKQNPSIAEKIHNSFWDKAITLQDRAQLYRIPWDTHPELADLDYHLFTFNPKFHAVMLYRIDEVINTVHIQFVCDSRENNILSEMIEEAKKTKILKL